MNDQLWYKCYKVDISSMGLEEKSINFAWVLVMGMFSVEVWVCMQTEGSTDMATRWVKLVFWDSYGFLKINKLSKFWKDRYTDIVKKFQPVRAR